MLSVLSQVNQVWCSFFFDANFTKEQILQILQSERKNTLFLLLIFFCSWIKWSKLLSPLILFINTYSVLTRQELFHWKYNSTLWLATKLFILSTFFLSTSSFIFQIHESGVEFLTFLTLFQMILWLSIYSKMFVLHIEFSRLSVKRPAEVVESWL